MTEEKSTKKVKTAAPENAGEAGRKEISDARQPFMGHDFLRRNLLVLLPPPIKPVTRRVN
jgi:hypothetical protein